ncbi:MAG: AAA family ATPase [Alphaproteobacteria bacterium]|nr:AAA family ATPase [Alphaproteobacteria bacterium]
MNELALQGADGASEANLRPFENGMPSLRYGIGIAQSRWRLGAIAAAAIFLVVLAAGLLMPRGHYAQALLIIHPVASNLAQPANEQAVLPPDTSAIDTEVEVLRSPAVAEGVVRKLALYKDPEFGGNAKADATGDVEKNAVLAVVARSTIRRIGLTYAVQVGFSASSTAKAQRIADTLLNVYIQRKLDQKLAAVAQANRDLGSTLGGLRDQALQAESRVEKYKAENNLLGAEGTASTEAELSSLDQQVSGARADSAERLARLAAAASQARDDSGGTDTGTALASSTVGALRQKEAEVSAQLSQLQTEFQPDYPLVKKAQAELDTVRAQIRSEMKRIISSLRAEASAASRKEASLLASRQQTQARLETNNRARVGLLTLQQAADSSKKIYETYLTRASEVAVARSLQRVDADVESKALPMPASTFTNPKVILALALLLALLAGAAAIVVSEIWSRRIRSWSDVARDIGLPLAGFLPNVVSSWTGDPAEHIASQPMTAFAEGFRNLRAYLALSVEPGKSQVIAVTSAVPGEGKTLVSACLARTLAAAGSRVVLLNCDMRKAATSKLFAGSKFGIGDVVSKAVSIEQALTYDAKTGIWYLSAHLADALSAELFSSSGIDGLLKTLAERFDRIVIDTPPLLGFADGRILAAKADRVLYVVQWDKTSAATAHAAVTILRQYKARIAGVILNKVDVHQQARYGFGDGSDYSYYYGSAYAQRG